MVVFDSPVKTPKVEMQVPCRYFVYNINYNMRRHVMFPMRQDIREAIELGLHMNMDNDLEVLGVIHILRNHG